jgi:nicotinamide-nucleotide amidase
MSFAVTTDELDYVEIDRPLVELAVNALASAERNAFRGVTAESCTGGLIATVLSEAPGAADYFDGAFVCYTADHKCAALGVDPKLIERDGVVSREVAIAMANDALAHSDADLAVVITGVAGPERDEDGNPVGLVYLACVRRGGDSVCVKQNFGDIGRSKIRYRAASEALTLLAEVASR